VSRWSAKIHASYVSESDAIWSGVIDIDSTIGVHSRRSYGAATSFGADRHPARAGASVSSETLRVRDAPEGVRGRRVSPEGGGARRLEIHGGGEHAADAAGEGHAAEAGAGRVEDHRLQRSGAEGSARFR
jgi:hypothetical protein